MLIDAITVMCSSTGVSYRPEDKKGGLRTEYTDLRRAANRRCEGLRCDSKSVSQAGSTMQEAAPTEGRLLTTHETTVDKRRDGAQ